MHIWFISIFEQTPVDKVFSTRFISIANEAISRGHKVTFFASTFKHNTKNQRYENTTTVEAGENYELVFIKSKSYQKNISLKRLYAHYHFAEYALNEMTNYPKPDIILMAFPPITLTYVVSKWAKQNGIPVVMDIIDPWPDSFTFALPAKLKALAKPVIWFMGRKLQKTLRNTSALTAISQQYITWAKTFEPNVPTTQVFYPAADYQTIHEQVNGFRLHRKDKRFNVLYAGSLAMSYDMDCLLEAAGILETKCQDIHFYIAGAGQQAEKIKQYAETHQNLTYTGRLNKEELMRLYAECDLGCTQHIKGATQSVTYKLFDLLSAGLPILNSLESEMKEIIKEHEVGLHNQPGNSSELADNILVFHHNRALLQEYIHNGYKLTTQFGDAKYVYGKFVDLMEKLKK